MQLRSDDKTPGSYPLRCNGGYKEIWSLFSNRVQSFSSIICAMSYSKDLPRIPKTINNKITEEKKKNDDNEKSYRTSIFKSRNGIFDQVS